MSLEAWRDDGFDDSWSARAAAAGWLNPTDLSKAILDVVAERQRQWDGEGFSPERNDGYVDRELAKAALCYVQVACWKDGGRREAAKRRYAPGNWPWSLDWWKPAPVADRRRDLVKAAALILAEIERIDRAAEREARP